MTASVTLLPAMLGFAGPRIDMLRVRRDCDSNSGGNGWWWRWSRQVQRRPWLAGGAALAALALLAMPFGSLRLAFTDAGTSPASDTSRHAYDLIAKGFGPGANGPLLVAVSLPRGQAEFALSQLHTRLATQPDVSSVSPAEVDGIGGETAASIDTAALMSRHLAIVVAFVIALSVLLLTVAFRSVLVPLISVGMTLISTIAAYGAIVAVFQWGWLGPGIDAGATAPVDPWIPLMLFALLFGFSMDYQVFLVSRIRDECIGGASDSDAVANGLAATGRIITSAAAIMICVFGAFVLGDLRVLRVIGFGMAVAVLLDATLVRMVAMPSALRLAGRSRSRYPACSPRGTSGSGYIQLPPKHSPGPLY